MRGFLGILSPFGEYSLISLSCYCYLTPIFFLEVGLMSFGLGWGFRFGV